VEHELTGNWIPPAEGLNRKIGRGLASGKSHRRGALCREQRDPRSEPKPGNVKTGDGQNGIFGPGTCALSMKGKSTGTNNSVTEAENEIEKKNLQRTGSRKIKRQNQVLAHTKTVRP
jgi:hypothetical protein